MVSRSSVSHGHSMLRTENVKQLAVHYLSAMWRRKWWGAAACWTICIVGWIAVAMLPRQYESQARFYIDVDSLLTPLMRGIAIEVDPLQHLEYLRNTLLSRPNLEQVMHLSDLDSPDMKRADKDNMLAGLANDIHITPQTTNMYLISYRNVDPTVAKNVVQSLLTLFGENSAGNSRAEMDKAQEFLTQEITQYEQQLRAAEQRKAQFQQQNADFLPGAGTEVPRLDDKRHQVAQLTDDYDDTVTRRDQLKTELASVPQFLNFDAGTTVIIGNNVTNAHDTPTENRLTEAKQALEQMRLRYTDQHPDVIAVQKQVDDLKAQVEQEKKDAAAHPGAASSGRPQSDNPVYDQLKVRLVDAEGAVASAKRRLDDARAEMKTLEDAALKIPEIEAKAQDLDRDYNIIKHNYEELLQRREATNLGQAVDEQSDKVSFRVVDAPQVPITPVAPQRAVLFSVVLVIGLGAGGGLALLIAQFDRSYISVAHLQEIGLPVLGSIGYVAPTTGKSRLATQATFGLTAVGLILTYGLLVIISTGIFRGIV